jgi:hypothetical protein
VRDRARGDASFGAAGSDDHGTVAEHELDAMLSDAKTLLESKRATQPFTCLGDVVVRKDGDDGGPGHRAVDDHTVIVTGGSREGVATYAL